MARTVGWATGISKACTVFVKRTYMEGGPNEPVRKGGVQGPRTPCAGCGLGQKRQQSEYDICVTYVHEGLCYAIQLGRQGFFWRYKRLAT
jgi:hypothetical protein